MIRYLTAVVVLAALQSASALASIECVDAQTAPSIIVEVDNPISGPFTVKQRSEVTGAYETIASGIADMNGFVGRMRQLGLYESQADGSFGAMIGELLLNQDGSGHALAETPMLTLNGKTFKLWNCRQP